MVKWKIKIFMLHVFNQPYTYNIQGIPRTCPSHRGRGSACHTCYIVSVAHDSCPITHSQARGWKGRNMLVTERGSITYFVPSTCNFVPLLLNFHMRGRSMLVIERVVSLTLFLSWVYATGQKHVQLAIYVRVADHLPELWMLWMRYAERERESESEKVS